VSSAREFCDEIVRTLSAAPDIDRIVAGCIVRFSTNGKRGDDSGWCKLFEDGRAGVFGNWRTGEQHTWHASDREYTDARDRQRDREVVAAAQEARAVEEAQRHARAAEAARRIWTNAQPCVAHGYLDRKGVGADHIRVQFAHAAECRRQFFSDRGPMRGLLLLVPVRDMEWRLWSLQAIDSEGNKSFLRAGRTRGMFHVVGGEKLRRANEDFTGPIAVAEGYATAWSIAHELDQWPTFVAFSAGNLVPVANAVRRRFPRARITICGDNDESGRGQQAAESAAAEIGGLVAIPASPGDWNDVARRRARSGEPA